MLIRRANVEAIHLARQVPPGESLAVRLDGTLGSDGSWALETVLLRRKQGRVVLDPRVRRVLGPAASQHPLPLDRVVHLVLPPGPHVIEVLGSQRTLRSSVVVALGAGHSFPTTQIRIHEAAAPGGPLQIELVGKATDGFVARLEWRAFTSSGRRGAPVPAAAAWHDVVGRAEGGCMHAWVTLRPEDARRIEARAVDGQGSIDPTPAVADLE